MCKEGGRYFNEFRNLGYGTHDSRICGFLKIQKKRGIKNEVAEQC